MVIVGAGPIIVVDKEPTRLDAAKSFGADVSVQPGEAAAAVAEASGGLGADVVIEAVGIPETFELCTKLVRPGGHVANVGVHGAPATLHLEKLWIKNVTITTGLVDTSSTPRSRCSAADHHTKRPPSGKDGGRFVRCSSETPDACRSAHRTGRAAPRRHPGRRSGP